jgi:hypothetical protein
VLGVVLLGMVVWLAVTLALEDRQQRRTDAEIDRASSELKSAGVQIAYIKDADLQSMNDYISAYAQIEPLQKEYDQKLQNMVELYRLAESGTAIKALSSDGFTASITLKRGNRCRKSSPSCKRSTASPNGKSPSSTP